MPVELPIGIDVDSSQFNARQQQTVLPSLIFLLHLSITEQGILSRFPLAACKHCLRRRCKMYRANVLLPSVILASLLAFAVSYRKQCTAVTNKRQRVVLGVDFGGTAMKLALIDPHNGTILERKVVPIAPSRTPSDIVQQIFNAADSVLQQAQEKWSNVEGLGVCCPGRVENGVVTTVANLKDWSDIPLEQLLRMKTGLTRVHISNDANAALAGEMWSGAAAHFTSVVMITLGTGVGGAVACDGMILRGSTGMFGEIGHHIINVNGRLSKATGVRGIAEEYCSARALKRTWIELSGLSPAPEPEQILKEAQDDPVSLSGRVAQFTFEHIGVLIINACRAYDPQCVILGGGLCANDWFLEECRRAADKQHWTLAPPTYSVVRAVHGNWAGVVGAAAISITKHFA